VLDPIDPINYAASLGGNSSRGILAISVHGDLVIPNTVADFTAQANTVDGPLAGSNPLLITMGLAKQSASSGASANPVHMWAEFGGVNDGMRNCSDIINLSVHHSSLLRDSDALWNSDSVSATVFTEMQSEVIAFLESGGTQYTVVDDTYLCAN
jgi:hypothetical protein